MSEMLSKQGQGGGVADISLVGLALAAALILVQGAASVKLGLGMHTQLLVGAVRCVVQLSLLGYILVPIFNYGHLWLVLLYASFMIWISAVEAIGRPSYYYKGMFLNTLLIIAACASGVMAYALLLIIGVKPWWSAQYLIPILGMVLGNTISGISIGLASVIEELSSGRDQVERLLALGASRSEATADLLGRSVKLAMTPLLNQMSVVGLVSIPGMMTGQILSGSNPDQAARYQMVIMFLLGAASTSGSVAAVYSAVFNVVDSCHRLRPDRLIPRSKKYGVNGFINEAATQLWRLLVSGSRKLAFCLCYCCIRARRRRQAAKADSTDAADGPSSSGDLKQPLLAAAEQGEAGSSSSSRNGGSSKPTAAKHVPQADGSTADSAEGQQQQQQQQQQDGDVGDRIEVVTVTGDEGESQQGRASSSGVAAAASGLKGAP